MPASAVSYSTIVLVAAFGLVSILISKAIGLIEHRLFHSSRARLMVTAAGAVAGIWFGTVLAGSVAGRQLPLFARAAPRAGVAPMLPLVAGLQPLLSRLPGSKTGSGLPGLPAASASASPAAATATAARQSTPVPSAQPNAPEASNSIVSASPSASRITNGSPIPAAKSLSSGAAPISQFASASSSPAAASKTALAPTASTPAMAVNVQIPNDAQTIALGERLAEEEGCRACHRIKGSGGSMASDLTNVGSRRSPQWIFADFKDPQGVSPGTLMPRFLLSDDELRALTAFLLTLKG